MKKRISLSIFFPSLNDAKSLPMLVQKATNVAQKVSNDYEIIVINDGSTDDTREVLTKLEKNFPHLRSIHHPINRGYGGALKSGFKAASKEWVFYTDGDGQYDPMELTFLFRQVNDDVDVVNGFKLKRNDSFVRTYVGIFYNYFLHHIYQVPISDIDCDFRLIRNAVLKKIQMRAKSGLICLELTLKLKKVGARFKEVGVHHYERKFGKSQFFQIHHLVKTLTEHVTFFVAYFLHRV